MDKPYVFTFGQYWGKRIDEIPMSKLVSYFAYLKEIRDAGPLIKEAIEMIQMTLEQAQYPAGKQ